MISTEVRNLARRRLTLEKLQTIRLGRLSIVAQLGAHDKAVRGSPTFTIRLHHAMSFSHPLTDCIICMTMFRACFPCSDVRRHPELSLDIRRVSIYPVLQVRIVITHLQSSSGATVRFVCPCRRQTGRAKRDRGEESYRSAIAEKILIVEIFLEYPLLLLQSKRRSCTYFVS